MILKNFLLLVIVGVAAAVSISGQNSATTASLNGTVRDAAGQAIPGAVITLRELTTNNTRQTTSETDGQYRFSVLPVGSYEVRAESSGFAPYVNKEVTVAVGRTTTLDITLATAGVQAEVS